MKQILPVKTLKQRHSCTQEVTGVICLLFPEAMHLLQVQQGRGRRREAFKITIYSIDPILTLQTSTDPQTCQYEEACMATSIQNYAIEHCAPYPWSLWARAESLS